MNTLNKKAQAFVLVMNDRLDVISEKTRVNEFSGNNIMAVKSIIIQLMQADAMTLTNRKLICLDILIAVEGVAK